MRHAFLKRTLLVLCATTAALSYTGGTLAQVGVLNPNPTMPSESRVLGGYGSSGGGMGIGRGPVPPGEAREENPADAMLKGIEGTNYGRYRGHAVFPQGAANGARSARNRSRPARAAAPPVARRNESAASPTGGRPENRWRYRVSQDRWWYLMDGGRWSYFNGSRWVPYRPERHDVSSARRVRTSQQLP